MSGPHPQPTLHAAGDTPSTRKVRNGSSIRVILPLGGEIPGLRPARPLTVARGCWKRRGVSVGRVVGGRSAAGATCSARTRTQDCRGRGHRTASPRAVGGLAASGRLLGHCQHLGAAHEAHDLLSVSGDCEAAVLSAIARAVDRSWRQGLRIEAKQDFARRQRSRRAPLMAVRDSLAQAEILRT